MAHGLANIGRSLNVERAYRFGPPTSFDVVYERKLFIPPMLKFKEDISLNGEACCHRLSPLPD